MHRFGMGRVGVIGTLLIATVLAVPAIAQTPSEVSSGATASELAVRSPTATQVTTTTTTTTSTTTTTVPATPVPGRALLISDSAWLSFKLYGAMDSVQGFDHTLALASCRRRVATSCTNFDGYVPITMFDELDAHPDGYGTLIVATGYNDGDQNFNRDVDDIVTLARFHGYQRVVWLTLRSNVSYSSPDDIGFAEVFERGNAKLQQIVDDGTYPDLVIADWATFARDQPAWFASDGIHLRRTGTYAAGDYISRKMAFLDAQPCPNPTAAGRVPLDPCPDPDVHGPIIDIESLYPVGQQGPDANFQLRWEGSGSWPDPPWWAT